jgi:serine/threonine protein kinase
MVDFGEARFSTQTGIPVNGSTGYMPPETFLNKFNKAEDTLEPCDCWSLGWTFYQVFEGVRVDLPNNETLGCVFQPMMHSKDFTRDIACLFESLSPEKRKVTSLTVGRTPEPFGEIILKLLEYSQSRRWTLIDVIQYLIHSFDGHLKNCFENEKEAAMEK